MADARPVAVASEATEGDPPLDPAAVAAAQVVSIRERALQATQVRLMQEMKKLDANVAMFRSRNAKLQDELLQKEQRIHEVASQLKKSEDSVDELSYMVQMLQYQLSATLEGGDRHRPNMDLSKEGAVSMIQDVEVRRGVAAAVRPFGKKFRRIRSDYAALKRFTLDKMFTMQRSLQSDGEMLLKFVALAEKAPLNPLPTPSLPLSLPAPPPASAIDSEPPAPGPAPKRLRFPSFLDQDAPPEKCAQPHLTDAALSALETVAVRLTITVCRLSTAAGFPLDVATAPFSRNLAEQFGNLQTMLANLHKRVEGVAEQLALRLAQEQQEASTKKLRLLEEQEEAIQLRVAKCTELLLKAKTDPMASKDLSAAFAETEACIATSHKEPSAPLKVDKACQCSGGPAAKASENGRAAPGLSVMVQGLQMAPPAVETPTAARKPPRRTGAPAAVGAAPASAMFQKTVGNIEKLLEAAAEGSHFRLELEMLLREAKDLLANDPSRWQPPPPHQTCADDNRAVLAFKQWHLRRRVQLSKQQFLMESFFRTLKGWYAADQGTPSHSVRPSAASSPYRLGSEETSSSGDSRAPSLRPGHSLRCPALDKDGAGLPEAVASPTAAVAPPHRTFSQCIANARLQPLSPVSSPANRESMDTAVASAGDFCTSPAPRHAGDGLSRRRFDSPVAGRTRHTLDGPAEVAGPGPTSPPLLPTSSTVGCLSPKSTANCSFRLTPLRS
eukprot:EG_transcript_4535